MKKLIAPAFAASLLLAIPLHSTAREWHVATHGADTQPGSRSKPLRTIQRAADLAQPGDVVTVHEGVYRESVNPPRGGSSDQRRITFQAAKGAQVSIKGSEPVRNWTRVQNDVWKATLPNSFFGSFNPYTNLIRGDWFDPRGRPHHTGAVYLNGEWLVEAAKLEEVLAPPGTPLPWLNQGAHPFLLNVAWFRPVSTAAASKTPAAGFADQLGVQAAPCSEGGQCIGWIDHGDWAKYAGVDFGPGAEQLELRVASATEGGLIEIRLNGVDGELLGTASMGGTGDWQSWTSVKASIKPTRGVQTVCLVFKAQASGSGATAAGNPPLWFAQVDAASTTIHAQFPGVNPNEAVVEINVRQTVFYPDQPGRNFITVRGFTLRDAATPWAPPTAEQKAVIGTHWSKGWIIENNVVSHSICSGIALGKHGDEFDNTSKDTAEGYVKTIERGHARGWNRDTIGHHIVRNNTISHCEQAGIVGSLGAAFSSVYGNTIHDIHVRRLFTGAEMAGIKFHAAIDSVIRNNHIYRTCLGLWLDWMAQGTRVSANLFHDNGRDLFVEVNHGPFVVDNNLFLSPANLLDVSEGGAYAHNLFAGNLVSAPEPGRETPYHPPHSTAVAGLKTTTGGDCRFYNNVFIGRGVSASQSSGFGLAVYNPRAFPNFTGGNVFFFGAQPYKDETGHARSDRDPQLKVHQSDGNVFVEWTPGAELDQASTVLVTSMLLGVARVPSLPYVSADGSAITIDRDFLGKKRSRSQPTPGPFENPGSDRHRAKVRGE